MKLLHCDEEKVVIKTNDGKIIELKDDCINMSVEEDRIVYTQCPEINGIYVSITGTKTVKKHFAFTDLLVLNDALKQICKTRNVTKDVKVSDKK